MVAYRCPRVHKIMEHATALWVHMPDGMPDGIAVRQLIEAIMMED